MRVEAVIALGTLLILFDKAAHLRIEVAITLPILGVVVIHTVLMVVCLGDVARSHLECLQVEVLHK